MMPHDRGKKRYVFGCGNPLFGDDGFGPAVIEYLEAYCPIPEDTACIDAGTSIRGILFDLLLGEDKPLQIILVDALDFPGRRPGEVFQIDVEAISPAKIADFSPHQFPTINMLQEIRDYTNIDVRVLVAQIEAIPDEVRPGLSVALQQAVEPMCRLILQTLAGGAS